MAAIAQIGIRQWNEWHELETPGYKSWRKSENTALKIG
jgi:hypothetical protein